MNGARVTALLLLGGVLLGACDGNGPRSDIQIEYACEIGDDNCPQAAPPTACLSVHVTVDDGNSRRTVTLFDPEQNTERDGGFAEFRAMSGEPFTFDFELSEVMPDADSSTPVTLDFRYYSETNQPPTLGATLENVTRELLESEPLAVRLYPIGRWSSPSSDDYVPTARAFHQAIPLPNGDVLIFGGVRGQLLPTSLDGDRPAPFVYPVELYDESAHVFLPVQLGEGIVETDTARVLFGYRYLRRSEGQHVIRLIGGVTSDVRGAGGLKFDAEGGDSVGGTPVVPADGVTVAPTVDIYLDTTDEAEPRLVEIREVQSLPNGALSVVSSPQAVLSNDATINDASGVVYPELIVVGDEFTAPVQAYALNDTGVPGDPYDLAHTRIGSTATRLPSGATFIYGGNITTEAVEPPMLPENPVDSAAELHQGTTTTLIGGLPEPTGFHRAALVGPDLVLVTGGFVVQPVNPTVGPVSTFTTPPTSPLRILEVTESPIGAAVRADLPTNGYQTTVFHSLTDLGDSRFLIVGGSTLNGDGLSRLLATRQTGIVSGVGYAPLEDAVREPRFGHTATRLPGNRVLVFGGFLSDEDGSQLSTGPGPELIYLVDVDPNDRLAADACTPLVRRRDAGPRPDAALPPVMDAGFDAGMPDAGPMMMDAGVDGG